MSSERSFDSASMALRLRGLASIGLQGGYGAGAAAVSRPGPGGWSTLSPVLRRRPLPLVLAVALGVLVMACSDSDGRTLPPPDPVQTTTTPSTPIVQAPDGEEFTLSSPSFVAGQVIPVEFTCQGSGVSPDLVVDRHAARHGRARPRRARSHAADGFLHWVVAGIDPSVTGFGKGGVPEGVVQRRQQRRGAGAGRPRARRPAAAPTPTSSPSTRCRARWPSIPPRAARPPPTSSSRPRRPRPASPSPTP